MGKGKGGWNGIGQEWGEKGKERGLVKRRVKRQRRSGQDSRKGKRRVEQKWRGGGGREKKGEESRRGEEEDATAVDKRGKGKRSVASAMWMKVSQQARSQFVSAF